MSLLSCFLNCVILTVGFQRVFVVPTESPSPWGDDTNNAMEREDNCQSKCTSDDPDSSSNYRSRDCPPNAPRMQNVLMHGGMCACNTGSGKVLLRDDYRYTPGIGSRKFHNRRVTWNGTRKICIQEGGHLDIVNSFTEELVMMDLYNKSEAVVDTTQLDEAFVGVHDLYEEGDFATVLDESLAHGSYMVWTDRWGRQPDNRDGKGQNCVGTPKAGTLDDFDCDVLCAFFYEISELRFI